MISENIISVLVLIVFVSGPFMLVSIFSSLSMFTQVEVNREDRVFALLIVSLYFAYISVMYSIDLLVGFGFLKFETVFKCTDYIRDDCMTEFGAELALLFGMVYYIVCITATYSHLRFTGDI